MTQPFTASGDPGPVLRPLLLGVSILALVAGLLGSVPSLAEARSAGAAPAFLQAEPMEIAGPAIPTASPAGDVLINEVANGNADSDADGFFELRNWGHAPST